MKFDAAENFRVKPESKVDLKACDTKWAPDWAKEKDKKAAKKQALTMLKANRRELSAKQDLFWASDTYSMLIILQGMDTAGKDSVIKHVMSGLNPQGCQVTSFKTPSEEELNHTFLWRHMKALPARGTIGIFNRSYYEDVLIVKIHPEILAKNKLPPEQVGEDLWKKRYDDINAFERHLTRNGTVILKFFLHISKEKQRQRLLKRLDGPKKNWKFSLGDLAERERWDDYVKAYEEAINKTSTEWAPWYIIPADKRWVALASVSEILGCQIESLNLKYPKLNDEQVTAFQKAKKELEKEKE